MRFEFDPRKSARNKVKHGIDFIEAQALWNDPDLLERSARISTEPRFQIIACIGQTIWAATVTYRHENSIRLISVRHARHNEKALYHSGRE